MRGIAKEHQGCTLRPMTGCNRRVHHRVIVDVVIQVQAISVFGVFTLRRDDTILTQSESPPFDCLSRRRRLTILIKKAPQWSLLASSQLRSLLKPPLCPKLIPKAPAPENQSGRLNPFGSSAKHFLRDQFIFRVANPAVSATFVINLPYTLECRQQRLFDSFACDTTDHYLYVFGPHWTSRSGFVPSSRPIPISRFRLDFPLLARHRVQPSHYDYNQTAVLPTQDSPCRVQCNRLAQQSQMQHQLVVPAGMAPRQRLPAPSVFATLSQSISERSACSHRVISCFTYRAVEITSLINGAS